MLQSITLTPKQYLELEDQSDKRHEYRNGERVVMTGGTTNHNRLIVALCPYLNLALMDQDAEVFSGDVKVWIPAYQLFTYPDLMMVQGEPQYYRDRPEHERQDTIENPSVVVEVLSKSTRQYDQSDKFDAYRTLDSLNEYILIDQYSFWVKQFTKNSQGQWLLTEFIGEDAVLKLQTIDFELAFKDLYKRVKFDS